MRPKMLGVLAVLALMMVTQSFTLNAQEAKKSGKKKGMATFMVIAPHTQEECLKALDDMSSESPKMLAKMSFGCMSGDHTGYASVEAENVEAVKNMLPAAEREKAKIIKVGKFSPEEIKKLHEKM